MATDHPCPSHAANLTIDSEASTRTELPPFISGTFDALLVRCILRRRCLDCGHDEPHVQLPSVRVLPVIGCAADVANRTHRKSFVTPKVPARQWVLHVPLPLRRPLATLPDFVMQARQGAPRDVKWHLLDHAGSEVPQPGSPAATSRCSSA